MVDILLVEDNPGDILLTKESFAKAKLANRIHVAEDGEQALDYLYQRNGYEDAVKPDLILLDLNMPKKNGLEVLADIKSHKTLKRTPVVIMTSSKEEKDVINTYDLHANSYIVKPMDLEEFDDVVNTIEEYWFNVVVTEKSLQNTQ